MKDKILVIDDDNLFRETVRMVLEQMEYEVIEADNGITGISLAKQHLPKVILCDVRMREMHGYATSQALKEDTETARIPVIMMTGFASQLGERRGKDAGADYYLAKPFQVSQLVSMIKKAIVEKNKVRYPSDLIK